MKMEMEMINIICLEFARDDRFICWKNNGDRTHEARFPSCDAPPCPEYGLSDSPHLQAALRLSAP